MGKGYGPEFEEPARQIVGIVGDVNGFGLNPKPGPIVYVPMAQVTDGITAIVGRVTTLAWIVRTRVAPYSLRSAIETELQHTSGLIGLVLALMGIYGTVSYIVVLRTREIGIRMAVGAQRRDILGLILRESTRPVLAGLLVGMLLAVGASHVLRGLLFGLNTVDGISFVGVSLLFLAIALLAAYPPARRAMRVDPMVALRYE